MVAAAPSPSPSPDARAEEIFAAARAALVARTFPSEISYGVRVSGLQGGTWRGRTYRTYERWPSARISARTISEEETADPYKPKGTNVAFFTFNVGGTESKTQMDVLGTPNLAITYTFGLAPAPAPAQNDAAPPSSSAPRVISTVTVAKRNYDVRLAGETTIDDRSCWHLTLSPLGNAGTYRVRDLYVEEATNQIVRLRTDGNFTNKATGKGLWTIDFANVGDAWYIADESSDGAVDTDAGHFDRIDVRFVDPASDPHENLDFGLSGTDDVPTLMEPT
jgi:hypothetical protein